MMAYLKEVFEESIQPVELEHREPALSEDFKAGQMEIVRRVQASTSALEANIKKILRTRRTETLTALRNARSAAVSRADYRDFRRSATDMKSAIADGKRTLEYHRGEQTRVLPMLVVMDQSFREFTVRSARKIESCLVRRISAQHELMAFFADAADTAKGRFDYLTTDPEAYAAYAQDVSKNLPGVMARLAR